MRTITALAAAAALSMASADLQCTITNVTAGVVKIDQHGSTHYGGHASCSYTFAGKVTSVTKIEGNHCDSCTQEGNYSVSCACKCKSITCDFESHSEVTLDTNHTTGKCSCSH